jgi:hypothetical protein
MIEVKGLDEAIEAVIQLYDERDIEDIAEAVLHRLKILAVDMTPVDTGAMQSAWVIENASLRISDTAVNPRSGLPVLEYAEVIDARYGILNQLIDQGPSIAEQEATRYGFSA